MEIHPQRQNITILVLFERIQHVVQAVADPCCCCLCCASMSSVRSLILRFDSLTIRAIKRYIDPKKRPRIAPTIQAMTTLTKERLVEKIGSSTIWRIGAFESNVTL